jgi:sodium transport system ATP-binding protein
VIALHQLRKRFGSVMAVSDVSFVAANGEVTGLLGPNGAGKTTTLRLLTGVLKPERGTVSIDGIDVHREPFAARARLGVVPETVGLYDRLTVREHLLYSARLHGGHGLDLRHRVDAALERADLTRVASRRASSLSLGQRRRVALARALVHQPGNVLFDEPTNGLDVLGVRDMRAEIRRLAAAGCAVIVSTHVMPEISAVCDRIVVLAKGEVVAIGTPGELQERTGASTLEDAFVRTIGSAEGLN